MVGKRIGGDLYLHKTSICFAQSEHNDLIKEFEQRLEDDDRNWNVVRFSNENIAFLTYQNFDETGQHTPGPSTEAVRFLVEQRDVLGFGSEAIGTDAGQGYHLRPPYPCHYYMHGAGRYGLQCLSNLDLLPPAGAVLICPPLKIQKGSGSPLRVLALVGQDT